MNYKENIQFKRGVMRRVYAIWLFRKTFNLKTGLFALLVWQITLYVSFGNVTKNLPSFLDIPSVYGFMVNAFLHTEIMVKLFFIFIAVFIFLLMKDIVHSILNFNIPIRIKGRFN